MARQSRQAQTRAVESRRNNQRPEHQSVFQSTLHIPKHVIPDGMTYAWVRAAWMDRPDNNNVSAKIRGGWSPVPRDRHADMFPIIDIPGVTQSNAAVIAEGGLILCEMPTKKFLARRKEIESQNNEIMNGIAWQTDGGGFQGAPTFNDSSRVVIERQIRDAPEFQDE